MELRKQGDNKGYPSGLGKLEKEEQKQRGKAMWWWALRGAMYENVSKYDPCPYLGFMCMMLMIDL